jgi:hypothetical protein
MRNKEMHPGIHARTLYKHPGRDTIQPALLINCAADTMDYDL